MGIPIRRVSVICTSFNKAAQLYRHIWCINSQTYPHENFRLIVIDDGSVDATPEVLKDVFSEFPDLNLVNIRTNRKPLNWHGGQGIAMNIGIKLAQQWGSEYVILTGGDILVPSFAIQKHLEMHDSPEQRAWAISTQVYHEPDPNTCVQNMLKYKVPDILLGPQQYWIRPDHESIGEDYATLALIPDRYDWQPAEKLLLQPEATTLEEFPGGGHIYIGYTHQRPLDPHFSWPTWQSFAVSHWVEMGAFPECANGSLWEDEDLNFRFLEYQKHLLSIGHPGVEGVTHPDVQIYHQPHQRQLSFDQRELLREARKKHPYKANIGTDWGKAPHQIVEARP
jgi:glycosyltransferase involved in cell wall biosynthesis